MVPSQVRYDSELAVMDEAVDDGEMPPHTLCQKFCKENKFEGIDLTAMKVY